VLKIQTRKLEALKGDPAELQQTLAPVGRSGAAATLAFASLLRRHLEPFAAPPRSGPAPAR
jgi:hypothetical protein